MSDTATASEQNLPVRGRIHGLRTSRRKSPGRQSCSRSICSALPWPRGPTRSTCPFGRRRAGARGKGKKNGCRGRLWALQRRRREKADARGERCFFERRARPLARFRRYAYDQVGGPHGSAGDSPGSRRGGGGVPEGGAGYAPRRRGRHSKPTIRIGLAAPGRQHARGFHMTGYRGGFRGDARLWAFGQSPGKNARLRARRRREHGERPDGISGRRQPGQGDAPGLGGPRRNHRDLSGGGRLRRAGVYFGGTFRPA